MKIWCCAWVAAAWWGAAAADGCNVTVDGRFYREDLAPKDYGYMYGLAVDHSTGQAYFSAYNVSNATVQNIKMDIISKKLTPIPELMGNCKFTVDQLRGYVHAGCRTYRGAPGGLYWWHSNPGRFVREGEAAKDIRNLLHHNKKLYYMYNPDNLLRTFVKGHSGVVSPLLSHARGLVFDGRGDLIFYNWTGVYRRRGDGAELMRYEGFGKQVEALAVDDRGAAYVCDNFKAHGVWRLHERSPTAVRLLDVPCTALAFDADYNMIYADKDRGSLLRLLPC